MKRIMLDLSGLFGEARQAVSVHVQNALAGMGIHWAGHMQTVMHHDADALCVERVKDDKDGKSGLYAYENGTLTDKFRAREVTEDTQIFDAIVHTSQFLAAVKEHHTGIVREFAGVPVRITRDGIHMDASALLSSVEKQAHALRKKHFNVPE
jgi:hypothetical protein